MAEMKSTNYAEEMKEYLDRFSVFDRDLPLLNLDMSLWGRELIREAAETEDWTEEKVFESGYPACLAGLTVALYAAPEKISELSVLEDRDLDTAIEEEAQRLLGLSNAATAALFHPGSSPDRHMTLEHAAEDGDFHPGDVAQMLSVAMTGEVPNWNVLFDEDEENRIWDDIGLTAYPSQVLEDQGYDDSGSDGISIREAIETAFEDLDCSFRDDLMRRIGDSHSYGSKEDAYNALYDVEIAEGLRFIDYRNW